MTKNVQFSDVPAGKWYETAVKTLASKGVITGYTDGTFKPTKSVTRAEFCAMASRFFSLKEGSVKFTDVPTTFWGYKYIASVVARGYLDDVEGAYEPNGAITRAEVVSIVNRMLSRSADSAYLAKGGRGPQDLHRCRGDRCVLSQRDGGRERPRLHQVRQDRDVEESEVNSQKTAAPSVQPFFCARRRVACNSLISMI